MKVISIEAAFIALGRGIASFRPNIQYITQATFSSLSLGSLTRLYCLELTRHYVYTSLCELDMHLLGLACFDLAERSQCTEKLGVLYNMSNRLHTFLSHVINPTSRTWHSDRHFLATTNT